MTTQLHLAYGIVDASGPTQTRTRHCCATCSSPVRTSAGLAARSVVRADADALRPGRNAADPGP